MKKVNIKRFSLLLASLFTLLLGINAQNVTINGITYAAISETEATCYGSVSGEPLVNTAVSIPSTVEMEVTVEGKAEKRSFKVTSINAQAFQGCTDLVKVSFPSTVKIINNFAFAGCTNLQEVWLSHGLDSIGNNAFEYTAIQYIKIPNSVKHLGTSIFANCKELTYAELGEGHTRIKYQMFYGCEKLHLLFIPINITRIEGYAFDGCTSFNDFLLPSTILVVDEYAFTGCGGKFAALADGIMADDKFNKPRIFYDNKFTSVLLSQNNWIFANSAFAGSSELKEVTMGGFVHEIPQDCFYDCPELETLNLEAGIEVIHSGAFNYCRKIREVVTPGTLEFIGEYAFAHCDSMRRIVLNEGLETIGQRAFSNGKKTEKIVIPSTVSVIGSFAFEYCSGVLEMNCELSDEISSYNYIFNYNTFTEVKIGEGVTRVSKNLFQDSRELQKVSLPNSLKEIGATAFSNCPKLTEIKIPAGVTKMGSDAFYNCNNLKAVYASPATPPSVYYPFSYTTYENATLYVPAGAKEAYQTADYWKKFTNIVEMNFFATNGDLNGDESTDVSDLTLLVNIILGNSSTTDAADLNDDGSVDVSDLTKLVSIILGSE
ncbi:MAG: leucine-rich repeat protein [Bacteroidaceae bacterium]|nr:leucine-rich repeat protein [Bacteroidaceae bacterium]